MQFMRSTMVLLIGLAALFSVAAAPSAAIGQQRGGGAAPAAEGQRGGRGGGGNRGGFQTMNVLTTAWPDGGTIPLRYTQAGGEISPNIQWSNVPTGTESFVLMFKDLDAVGREGSEMLHWMVWNIPGTTTSIPQGRPSGPRLEDGSLQVSVSGYRYRGPGASSTGPMHHYLLEVYALDTMLEVDHAPQIPRGENPVTVTRANVMEAMQGHVRGKGTYVGLFRRPQ